MTASEQHTECAAAHDHKAPAGHSIRWTFDRGGVTAEAVCHGKPGDDCRLTSVSCECEVWGEIWRREDGTIWHKIVDYGGSYEPVWHQVVPQDDCNVCLFINEPGCVEELGRGTFVIAETPIEPIWLGDGCEWKPAAAHEPTIDKKLRAAIEAAVLRRVADEIDEIRRIGTTPYDQVVAEIQRWKSSPFALLSPSAHEAFASGLRAEADRIEEGAR